MELVLTIVGVVLCIGVFGLMFVLVRKNPIQPVPIRPDAPDSASEFNQKVKTLEADFTKRLNDAEAAMRRDLEKRKAALQHQSETELKSAATHHLVNVFQRLNTNFIAESTTAIVHLPNEEMKGRLIGREGRNIRTFEQVTGADLIIDDTPLAVIVSCFDPVRREAARLALQNLILDGRIHPGRIEECHSDALNAIESVMDEAGDKAVKEAGVEGLSPAVIKQLGRLKFRTSAGQNMLTHSTEVAMIARTLAAELGLDAQKSATAGLLHDIGKGLNLDEFPGPHALAGMEFLSRFKMDALVLNAVGAHHREITPESLEAEIVIIADTISATRPGARRETLENFTARVSHLEGLAKSFAGVEHVYAVQAGRELRVLVKPDEISDAELDTLAQAITERLEEEKQVPGQIRVTLIRESRTQKTTK